MRQIWYGVANLWDPKQFWLRKMETKMIAELMEEMILGLKEDIAWWVQGCR